MISEVVQIFTVNNCPLLSVIIRLLLSVLESRQLSNLSGLGHLFNQSSFSVLPKVGNVGIFVMLKSENKFDTFINRINFNSAHHDKFHLIFNFIQLLSISILFLLEAIQKCQLYVLGENSSIWFKSDLILLSPVGTYSFST